VKSAAAIMQASIHEPPVPRFEHEETGSPTAYLSDWNAGSYTRRGWRCQGILLVTKAIYIREL